jgi:3-methylcrotonyl-CoA carboxylase alpha subunit
VEDGVEVEYLRDVYRMSWQGQSYVVKGDFTEAVLRADIDGRRCHATAVIDANALYIVFEKRCEEFIAIDPRASARGDSEDHAGLLAPMPGRIVALLADSGATVAKGAPLLVMEAMKMEHTVTAPAAGIVTAFRCAVGDQVARGAALIDFESNEPE